MLRILAVCCMLNCVASFLSTGLVKPALLNQRSPLTSRSKQGSVCISMATTFSATEVAADRDVIKRVALQKEGELQVVLEAMKRLEKASKAEKDENVNSALLQKLTGRCVA